MVDPGLRMISSGRESTSYPMLLTTAENLARRASCPRAGTAGERVWLAPGQEGISRKRERPLS